MKKIIAWCFLVQSFVFLWAQTIDGNGNPIPKQEEKKEAARKTDDASSLPGPAEKKETPPSLEKKEVVQPGNPAPLLPSPDVSRKESPLSQFKMVQDPGLGETGESKIAKESLYILADLYTHVTPFASLRLTEISGRMNFDSMFGGRKGSHLDLLDDLFLPGTNWGSSFGVDVQHSYFHISVAYGFNSAKGKGNIGREVIVADSLLQKGARTSTDMNTHWFYATAGYTVIARETWGFGPRLGLNYAYIRFTGTVDGFLADDPSNERVNIKLENNLFIPIPTLGAYFDFGPSENLVLRTELDFMFYDIGSRRLGTVNFGIEARYFFSATQKYYGSFKFQYEYFSYDFKTNLSDGFYEWHSFLFLFGVGTKF